jgi:hypothetical protein
MGEMRNAYNIFVAKPKGKRPLERYRSRWDDDIRVDLGEIGWPVIDWVYLAWDRDQWRELLNTILNLRVP